MVITFNYKMIAVGVIGLIFIIYLFKIRLKKNKFETFSAIITYLYVLAVIKETQFPIFINNIEMKEQLGGVKMGRDINLIPFNDIINMTSVLNVLLFVPIGFILGFVIKNTLKRTVVIGLLSSFLIEMSQLCINVFVGYNFRIADINDIICNTLGAVIGYFIMIGFVKAVEKLFKQDNEFSKYISNRIS